MHDIPHFQTGTAIETVPSDAEIATMVAGDTTKYTIPSDSRPGVVYIMRPTGLVKNGKVEMAGRDVNSTDRFIKAIPYEQYAALREQNRQADAAELARGSSTEAELGRAAVGFIDINDIPDFRSAQEPATEKVEFNPEDLLIGLNDTDVNAVKAYARYSQDKRSAQRDGNGSDSMRYSQYMGEVMRTMSPQARDAAYQYASLVNE